MSAPSVPENLAEPVDRIVAYLIDWGILVGGAIAVGIVGRILGYIPVVGWIVGLLLSLAYMVAALGYCIYFTAMDNPYTQKGQTIGKKMRNIKVVKADGSDFTVMDAILRFWVGYFVSAIVLGLGFIFVFIDGNKQGWHDKIAKTYVVKAE